MFYNAGDWQPAHPGIPNEGYWEGFFYIAALAFNVAMHGKNYKTQISQIRWVEVTPHCIPT